MTCVGQEVKVEVETSQPIDMKSNVTSKGSKELQELNEYTLPSWPLYGLH